MKLISRVLLDRSLLSRILLDGFLDLT